MTRRKILTGAALVGIALVSLQGRAWAVGDAAVVMAVEEANSSITGAVSTNTATISEDLQTDLRLLSGQNTVNSKGVIQALSNIATEQDNRAVELKIEQATLHAENQASSGTSACNMITGTLAGEAINAQVAQAQEQGTEAELAWQMGGDKSHPSPSYNGRAGAISSLIAAHCRDSATQQDVEEGLCPAVTAPPSSQPGAAGAVGNSVPPDVDGGTIIDEPNDVIPAKKMPSMKQFMALAFNPNPMGAMAPGAATSQRGREEAYQRLVSAAQVSIPDSVVAGVLAARTPLSDSNQQIQSGSVGSGPVSATQWANGTEKQIAGSGAEPAGGYFPDGVSEDAWITVRADGWYMNPDWSIALNGYSEAQAVKDLTMIESFRAFLQNKQYHEGEEELLLLSSIDRSLQTLVHVH